MTAVVTGAAGFIGRHLVARLHADDRAVVGVDRRPTDVVGAGHLRADLLGADPTVDTQLRSADVVFHLAGSPGVRAGGYRVARSRWRDNVLAGARVLRVTPPDVPVIVASSSAVYGGARRDGDGDTLRASREDDVLCPRGGYARSKVLLERLCTRRAAVGGRVAVVRPFTVVGEGQRPDMALARWLAAARRGEPLAIYGSGGRRRDLTDIRDVVEVLVRMWIRGCDATVNAGTGRPVTLDHMVRVIADVMGTTPATTVEPAHRDEVVDTAADTRSCAAQLGLVPTTDLHDVVARQLAVGGRTLAGGRHDHEITERAARPSGGRVAGVVDRFGRMLGCGGR